MDNCHLRVPDCHPYGTISPLEYLVGHVQSGSCVDELPVAVLLPSLHMHFVLHGNTRGRVQPIAGVKAGICWWRWWCWRSYVDGMAWGILWLWYSLLLLLLLLLCCELLGRNSWRKLYLSLSGWWNSWSHADLLLLRGCYTWSKSLALLWLLVKLLTGWRSKLLLLLLLRGWWRLSYLLLLWWRWRLVELLLLGRWRWLIELLLPWRRLLKLLLLGRGRRLVHLLLRRRRLVHLLLLWRWRWLVHLLLLRRRWRLVKLLLLGWWWRLIKLLLLVELLLLRWRCWLPSLLLLQIDI